MCSGQNNNCGKDCSGDDLCNNSDADTEHLYCDLASAYNDRDFLLP